MDPEKLLHLYPEFANYFRTELLANQAITEINSANIHNTQLEHITTWYYDNDLHGNSCKFADAYDKFNFKNNLIEGFDFFIRISFYSFGQLTPSLM